MKAHPLELALVAALATLQALRPLLVALVALVLTLAGYRPRQRPTAAPAARRTHRPAPMPASSAQPAPERHRGALASIDGLTVRQLRQLAREAGHRALARSGRRADLLEVLAA
jgi:hypothetical protein